VILLAHPTANQNVRQAALALVEAGILEEFWTCVNWKRGGFLDRCLAFNNAMRNELRRRSFPPVLQPFLKTAPWREWGRQFAGQLGLKPLVRDEVGPFSLDAVYHSLDRRVAARVRDLTKLKAVYAYDDGALESFRAAKDRGLKCIYEHPIVHWRKVRQLQREEAQLQPEWASTLLAVRDSEEKLARKDDELNLADVVVVPSTFARDSLADAPAFNTPVQVIPYGAPEVSDRIEPDVVANKLRVLYVGALSQAKGLSYLLEAMRRLEPHAELTLIGRRVGSAVPAQTVLDRHRWIPSLPHEAVLAEMSRHDVLVCPSLHEGFGLVILEAMAQQIPVITTANTGGPDVIDDGLDGFIVPIRSVDAIAEKLELLLRDGARLAAMKQAAGEKAALRQWHVYRQRLAALAREVIAR
jgi:glycosyltransferase involved in cell wall biosynthesis